MASSLSRRILLRGLGGAVVAAPFLRSVAERSARAQGAEDPGPPQRLIMMFTHYGCLTDRWFPARSHGSLSADDFVDTSLEALAPYADRILLPRGIRAMNEWTMDLSLGQGNDANLNAVGSYFTCMPLTPNSDDPFSFDSATKFNAKPMGPSLDHVCARQVSPGGAPLLLRVGGRSESAQLAVSYSDAEEMYPGIGSLPEAFAGLTGLLQEGPISPDSYRLLRGKSVLDLVRADLETLERQVMSQADRHALEQWKQLLDETGVPAARAACTSDLARELGLTAANLEATMTFPEDTDPVTAPVDASRDRADLYNNIAVLTAACDANRVILLKYPGNFVYRGLGLNMESHSLSRRVGSAAYAGPCVQGANEMIRTVDRYYATKFAGLVGTLASMSEGDTDLLENTATVWFQEFSDGLAENLNNLPIIQAGSCGGYFKTGQAVNVFDQTENLTRGNSEAACEPSGTQEIAVSSNKDFGTPADVANAPINKYFCNLMNAIGVRAGSDGFPAEGGTEEVTHYGMYDETTDFIGGGTNPPVIHHPGGFTELKA